MSVRDVHWEITNACNLRCPHCVQCSGAPRDGELSTVEALKVIRLLAKAGIKRIYWTGGEPFVRRDIRELMEHTQAQGIASAAITNGALLTEETLLWLAAQAVPLGISLDGVCAEMHDVARGRGAFASALWAIDVARQHEIPVTIYTTVTRRNFDALDDIIGLAESHGCGIHINEVSLTGRAAAIWPQLALGSGQREQLPHLVIAMAQRWYDETPAFAPDGCWADGTSIYLRADGQVFLCSEQVQHPLSESFGHILERSLSPMLAGDRLERCAGAACSYRVLSSEHVTLISNQPIICPLVPPASPIKTLDALNHALDALYVPFADVCVSCQDKCCRGFVWLMPDEIPRLHHSDVSTIEVNDSVSFIHSFPETGDGAIDVTAPSPQCSQLCSLQPRQCRVYADRPFSCRLYPIGFEVRDDGMLVWALHQDCQITRYLVGEGIISEFERRALQILDRIEPQLYTAIIETYRRVHTLATFPLGENNYCTLKEVVKIE